MPLLGEEAAEIGLVDYSLPRDQIDKFIYQEVIPNWNYDQVREKKWNNSAKSGKPLEAYREEELSEMKRNIFENNWGFKEKRENFVFKKPSSFVQKNLLPQWPA